MSPSIRSRVGGLDKLSTGRRIRVQRFLAAAALSTAPAGSVGWAQTPPNWTWATTTSGSWGFGSNWLNNPFLIPPITSDLQNRFTFPASSTQSYTAGNNLGSIAANGLTLANNGTGLVTVLSSSGSTINFAADGVVNPFIAMTGSGRATVNAFRFSAPLTIQGDGIGSLNLGGAMTGTLGITINRGGAGAGGLMGGGVNITSNQSSAITSTGLTLTNGVLSVGNSAAGGASGLTMTVNGGAFRSSSVSLLSWNYPLNLVGDMTFVPGGSISLTANISGAGNMRLLGGTTVTWGSTASALTHSGTGEVLVAPVARYVGSRPIVSAGRHFVLGTQGTLTSSSGINLINAAWELTGTATGTNRVADSINIGVHGGTLAMGGAAAGANETFGSAGAIPSFSGHSTVEINAAAGTSGTITLYSIDRPLRGTVTFRPSAGSGAGQFFFTVPPTLIGGGAPGTVNTSVIPWADGLMTYDPVVGVRSLTASESTTNFASAGAMANFLTFSGSPIAVSGAKTLNAMSVTGPSSDGSYLSVTGSPGSSLSLTSGVLFSRYNVLYRGLDLIAAPGELIVNTSTNLSNTRTVFESPLSATELTKTGFGELVLRAPSNTITGDVTINQGNLVIDSDAQLGAATRVVLAGGMLRWDGPTTTISRNILTAPGGGAINVTAGANLTLGSAPSGTGALAKYGFGVLTLSQPAAYTGYTSIDQGVLAISNPNQINTGTFLQLSTDTIYSGSALRTLGNMTVPNDIVINNAGTSSTQSTQFVGVDVPAGVSATFSGAVGQLGNASLNAGFAKLGSGTATFTGMNPHFGGITVLGGTMVLSGADGAFPNATGSTAFSGNGIDIDRGATMIIDNSSVVRENRISPAAAVTIRAGSLTLRGHATNGARVSMGTLSFVRSGTLTIEAASTGGVNLHIGTIASSTLGLIRGDWLGLGSPTTPVPQTATVDAGSLFMNGTINSGLNTPSAGILVRIFGDDSATGGGKGLLTYESGIGLRLLKPTEYTSTFVSGNVNVGNLRATSTTPPVTRSSFGRSLTIADGGTLPGSILYTTSSGNVLQQAGSGTINNRAVAAGNGVSIGLWTTGTLSVNGALYSTNSIFKGGGGALNINGTMIVAPNVSTGGGGISVGGGTLNIGASAILGETGGLLITDGGYVNLGRDASFGFLTGGTLFGHQGGGGTLNLGANDVTIGRQSGFEANFNSTVIGTGDVIKKGNASHTFWTSQLYSGRTVIDEGTVRLAGAGGALANTSQLDIAGRGATLELVNGGQQADSNPINSNRVNDSATINLAGTMRLTGYSRPVTETVGAIDVTGGAQIVIDDASTLQAASLARPLRGSLDIPSLNHERPVDAPRVLVAAPPSLSGAGGASGTTQLSILPWGTGQTVFAPFLTSPEASFLTYEPGVGLRALREAEYGTSFGIATENVRIPSGTFVSGGTLTANSLLAIDFGGDGTGTVAITSGGLILRTGMGNVNVQFGSAEGVVTVPDGDAATISGNFFPFPLTSFYGSNGVTKAGGGVLTLGTSVPFFSGTGPVTIAGGILAFDQTIQLPNDLEFTGGELAWVGASGATVNLSNSITLRSSTARISNTDTGPIVLSGVISGPGNIEYADAEYYPTNANTYTGDTRIFSTATLHIANDANLGNGGALRWSGRIIADDNWSTSRKHYVEGTSTINTNGNQVTFNGGVFGAIANSFFFNKDGAGTLILNAPGDTPTAWRINQGVIRARSDFALGSPSGGGTLGGGTLIVTNGGQLQLDNDIFVDTFVNLQGTGSTGDGNGALLNYAGNNTVTNTIYLSGATTIGVNPGSRLRISGGMSGAFGITKVGGGTLELDGNASYTGGTVVSTGTFLVNNLAGSAAGAGSVQVQAGAILGGVGSFSGALSAAPGAIISMGNSIGTLSTGSVTLATGSVLQTEIDFAGHAADQLQVTGTVNLNGSGGAPGLGAILQFTFVGGTVPTGPAQSFVIVRNDQVDAVAGTFDGIADDTPVTILSGLLQFVVDYNSSNVGLGTDGNDITVTFTAVPEPTTIWVFPLMGIAFRRRRSRR